MATKIPLVSTRAKNVLSGAPAGCVPKNNLGRPWSDSHFASKPVEKCFQTYQQMDSIRRITGLVPSSDLSVARDLVLELEVAVSEVTGRH